MKNMQKEHHYLNFILLGQPSAKEGRGCSNDDAMNEELELRVRILNSNVAKQGTRAEKAERLENVGRRREIHGFG